MTDCLSINILSLEEDDLIRICLDLLEVDEQGAKLLLGFRSSAFRWRGRLRDAHVICCWADLRSEN